jgi:hypothetical protein
MINIERLEDLRRGKEASGLSLAANQEREALYPRFKDFMESAFWHVQPVRGDGDEPPQFSRSNMFLAFRYGYKEAALKQTEGGGEWIPEPEK